MPGKYYNGYSRDQSKKAKSGRNTAILIIALLIAGIVMLGYGGFFIYKGYKSRNWPQTTGTIAAAYVERKTSRDSNTRKTSYKYMARIRYVYKVNGRSYTNDEIGYGKNQYTSRKESKTKKYLQQFPVGKPVKVFYNPENPAQAVLKQGITGGAILVLTVGIFFLLASSGMLYVFINSKRNARYKNQSPIEPSKWG